MRSRYILHCVVQLFCSVFEPRYAVPGYANAGTFIVWTLRALAEPMVVPVRLAIASGCMCARRVLAEPKLVCFRRKLKTRCDPGINFAVWYSCAAMCVGLDVQSRVVQLPAQWSCWLCVYC